MLSILKSYITIVSEIAILILGIIWYYNSKEIEPMIVIVSSSTLLLISIISYFSDRSKSETSNIVGGNNRKIVHRDFLYNYVPGEITINKIIEEFGHPLVKMKDSIIREWDDDKLFSFYVYKYKFSNAIVLFTTELADDNVLSITLVSTLNRKQPIKCRYSPEEDEEDFGKAKIKKSIIEKSNEFESNMFASWGYSAITLRYAEFRPIKYLNFTYFIYDYFKKENEIESKVIDGICISVMSDLHPIIHFDDYAFN